VLVRPAEVHRAGVDEAHAQHPASASSNLVGIALRDRRPRPGGGIEDRVGALPQDRSPGFEVELRGARAPSSANSALWLWTMAAPAARQRTASAAISADERGTEGFRSGAVTPFDRRLDE